MYLCHLSRTGHPLVSINCTFLHLQLMRFVLLSRKNISSPYCWQNQVTFLPICSCLWKQPNRAVHVTRLISKNFGSLTVSGKRIVFHRVTIKIERDTIKMYETRSKCTRLDEIVRDSMDLYEIWWICMRLVFDGHSISKRDSTFKRDSSKKEMLDFEARPE